ncbi:PREDICTED: organic cation transporter protein isoform X2 [Bactrocera latifrons]|uniref:Organic cation transporter protein n=1 Tax=Bactrocera latifrons TaxID=174628 RepID=A0A0K8WED0_BACLA|nr:PREDICTED: organic cation transporter protein isoform X2 [Bactrocera latifrons]
MDFDQILEEIGEFGRYQKTNYLLICLPVMFAAANSLSYVFTAGTPAYRCLIPQCDDPIEPQLHAHWLANATPGSYDKYGHFTPENCYRYKAVSDNITDVYHISECSKDFFNQNIRERCYSWVYDDDERTIVQEWQLTCKENVWKLAFVGTMHFAGLVVGTAISGYLADRFGRKNIFILCSVFMAITGIAQGLAWDYNSFLVFAFLNAVGTSGVYPLAFIIGVEMVGPSMREMSSIVLNYFYAVGEALVGATAWLLQDWQLIQYALSVPPLFFIAYYWFVPESVRWLLARNEREKAGVIIKRAAAINRRELSLQLLASFKTENCVPPPTPTKATDGDADSEKMRENGVGGKNEIWRAVCDIFKSKTLLIRYAIMLYIWAINAVVFYGLSLNSTNLSGNKYLNFVLVCLIEIPGYTLAWICLRKLGRRCALSGSLFLCAATCIAGGYITKGSTGAIVTLFLIGKLGITSSFAVVYTYTAEMIPTLIRSGGVGVMSTFARFGAMLAPFVPLLGTYYEALPLLLFGAASFSAGLLGLLLPETFRKKLPDTVAEAKQMNKATPIKKPAAAAVSEEQVVVSINADGDAANSGDEMQPSYTARHVEP